MPLRGQAGITLLEMMVVIAIIGLGVGVASLNLTPLETPLQSASTLLEGHLRQARLNAIATTSSYRVTPSTSTKLTAETAASCDASTWTGDPALNLEMPDGVTFQSTSWTVCFSSRGVSTDNIVITMLEGGSSAQVEVLLGGTTRLLE